jgi:hypothetical protein
MQHGRIHTIDLLAMALDAAVQIGFQIRQEALGGSPGGVCEIRGKKMLFLDPLQPAQEQLQLVLDVLECEAAVTTIVLPAPLAAVLKRSKAA